MRVAKIPAHQVDKIKTKTRGGSGMKIKTSIGKKYGSLVVLERNRVGKTKYKYKCICECGKITLVDGSNLFSGHTKSCGCKRIRHGQWKHPAFSIWSTMIQRCYRKSAESFELYSRRGIKVCYAWRRSPEKFIKWAESNGWRRGLQIDRIDNNKGYYPKNCRFTTAQRNSNNRSDNRILEINGEKITMADAARKFNINYTMLYKRILRGWAPEVAVNG